jgi:hypothetical protein
MASALAQRLFFAVLIVWLGAWLCYLSFATNLDAPGAFARLGFVGRRRVARVVTPRLSTVADDTAATTLAVNDSVRNFVASEASLSSSSSSSSSTAATTTTTTNGANFRQAVDFYPGRSRLPKPMRLSCNEILNNVTLLSSEPFARGFVKSVWLARLTTGDADAPSSTLLVVKRPASNDATALALFNEMMTKEIDLVRGLRLNEFIMSYYGACRGSERREERFSTERE